jgi:hypothetical protein
MARRKRRVQKKKVKRRQKGGSLMMAGMQNNSLLGNILKGIPIMAMKAALAIKEHSDKKKE